jgi:hypothetical protein
VAGRGEELLLSAVVTKGVTVIAQNRASEQNSDGVCSASGRGWNEFHVPTRTRPLKDVALGLQVPAGSRAGTLTKQAYRNVCARHPPGAMPGAALRPTTGESPTKISPSLAEDQLRDLPTDLGQTRCPCHGGGSISLGGVA